MFLSPKPGVFSILDISRVRPPVFSIVTSKIWPSIMLNLMSRHSHFALWTALFIASWTTFSIPTSGERYASISALKLSIFVLTAMGFSISISGTINLFLTVFTKKIRLFTSVFLNSKIKRISFKASLDAEYIACIFLFVALSARTLISCKDPITPSWRSMLIRSDSMRDFRLCSRSFLWAFSFCNRNSCSWSFFTIKASFCSNSLDILKYWYANCDARKNTNAAPPKVLKPIQFECNPNLNPKSCSKNNIKIMLTPPK